ncbi:TPA: SDR family oxidoreductase [Citrobacter farmeri]|uniref:SDR family oxidoreductase n=1 Tax=Citrobacter farmeri TaxID=67824 RepID=UPI0022A31EC2|nr:SDR family oxidoreductase [Citrobacter farmeri]MEC3931579.1 SDR family oxidoreductase [Citrobacter farmeri]HCW7014560.1 SDR family oxidoreductase [Citrobacter farmeri]
MGRLEGKYALITGGTSGIGLETARQFLAEGAKVAITGRSEKKLLEAKKELIDVVIFRTEAGDIPQQAHLATALQALWPRLDILYINAGDVTHKPLESWDEQAYDALMNTNLKGPFFLLKALLPMFSNPSSVIVCGSVSARIGFPQSSAYAASKAAILSLARTLSAELHPRGIRVNGLSPGPTETPALNNVGGGVDKDKLREEIRALVPIGRLGTPYELAKAAIFLASDESSFVVGTELLVDGGVGNL